MTTQEQSERQKQLRAEAIAAGKKTYFTGIPCKRGHTSERSAYHRFACMECMRENARAKYARHKEDVIAANNRWRDAHPEKVKSYNVTRRKRLSAVTEKAIPAADILKLLKIQRCLCALCRKPMLGDWTLDHIVALAEGGRHSIANIQLVHLPCNIKKRHYSDADYRRRVNGELL